VGYLPKHCVSAIWTGFVEAECYVLVRGMAATLEPESRFQQDQTNIPDSFSVETHLSTTFSPLLCLSV